MGENAGPIGLTEVRLDDALALFADGARCPASLTAEELAASALEVVEARLGRPLALLHAEQRHTALTFTCGAEGTLTRGVYPVGVCDALITAECGVALMVRTADCLPVVVAGGGVVAIVHAGWRGLAADILGATTRRLRAEFGLDPSGLEAVVGAGIGPCHYDVGTDVASALARHETAGAAWLAGGRVDLSAIARGRLLALGVPDTRVQVLAGCTACSPRHHSYRRDGTAAGRQWSAVVRLD